MGKVLSQAGISLADTYDVEGSIAGIEELETRDVGLVHEMGATIFSERVSGAIRRNQTAALNQSTAIDEIITALPQGPIRVLAVLAMVDTSGRMGDLTISLRAADAGGGAREIPIWIWDASTFRTIRLQDLGTTVARSAMMPDASGVYTPNMMFGNGQPQRLEEIAIRGNTSAFGAGTVQLTTLVYLAFSQTGGISSLGLPMPGW